MTAQLSCESWVAISTAPSMGQVTCFPESRRPFDKYGAVRPDQYEAAVDKACEAFAKKGKLQANEGRGSYLYQTTDGTVPYWFNVGVSTGHLTCDSESLDDPIGDGSHKCSTIFKNDIFWACKLLNCLASHTRPMSLTNLSPFRQQWWSRRFSPSRVSDICL